jgi:hypothetical protein
MLTSTDEDGHLVYEIPSIETDEYNRIGLIITRIDSSESTDTIGAYNIEIHL